MRSTEDEDSPKGYRSPKPATPSGGVGRKALFAGDDGQSGFFDSLSPPSMRKGGLLAYGISCGSSFLTGFSAQDCLYAEQTQRGQCQQGP